MNNTTKKTFVQRMKNMGPGAIVTAAVVGPGTVTSCGLAGYNFSFALAGSAVQRDCHGHHAAHDR